MSQSKTIYFKDYPSAGKTRSGLTVPFRPCDAPVFKRITNLSSATLRDALGYQSYSLLEAEAKFRQVHVASYARDLLVKNFLNQTDHSANDAIQSTFKGGRGSPMHDWFPYLEGYSPEFVKKVLETYAPNAESVLDPFCGSGTTALLALSLGLRAYYSEVNPVCRFIIDAKSDAQAMEQSKRTSLANELLHHAQDLPKVVAKCPIDAELNTRIHDALGKRPIFDSETMDSVLKLRSYLNIISSKNSELAKFLTIAVLRSLVPNSLMARRGDLRFRNASELQKFKPNLIPDVISSIELIASDLFDIDSTGNGVSFVCPNARNLSSSLVEKVDVVVTSPPYLNGTNYFRNTKIELCFMGYISRSADLRVLRDEAITAGINDVTSGKTRCYSGVKLPDTLKEAIRELEAKTYDMRIPLMVKAYFQEMDRVASGLSSVVRSGGVVAIDLGDSCYGGIHVPTDIILEDIMQQHSFELKDKVILRQRQSRDGRRLSQTLSVFSRN